MLLNKNYDNAFEVICKILLAFSDIVYFICQYITQQLKLQLKTPVFGS